MTDAPQTRPVCLYCKQNSEHVPLISLEYKGKQWHICPQHLPLLIHNPAALVGILPDADALKEADHHD